MLPSGKKNPLTAVDKVSCTDESRMEKRNWVFKKSDLKAELSGVSSALCCGPFTLTSYQGKKKKKQVKVERGGAEARSLA